MNVEPLLLLSHGFGSLWLLASAYLFLTVSEGVRPVERRDRLLVMASWSVCVGLTAAPLFLYLTVITGVGGVLLSLGLFVPVVVADRLRYRALLLPLVPLPIATLAPAGAAPLLFGGLALVGIGVVAATAVAERRARRRGYGGPSGP